MKIKDKLINAFYLVSTIFFLSLAVPITISLTWIIALVLVDVAGKIMTLGMQHPYMYFGSSTIIGIFLTFWLKEKNKRSKSTI